MLTEENLKYIDLHLGLYDICLAILYFAVIYIIAFHYKKIKIAKNPEYKYFILALTAKVAGGFIFALLTVYFTPGDSLMYFQASIDVFKVFVNNPLDGIDMIFKNYDSLNLSTTDISYYTLDFINGSDIWLLVRILFFINLLSLFSYGSTTIIFASISFIGLWMAYSNLCKLYPNYSKHLLISFFMIPTIMYWGSGVLKDTVTISCMGWMIYSFSNIFIFKRKIIYSFFIIFLASILIYYLKPYILYVLLPTLLIWGQTNLKNLIKGSFIRIILIPLIVITISISTFFVLKNISIGAGKYDINKIEQTLEGFQSWHGYLNATQNQSGYTLGEMEFTSLGFIKVTPAALNVTFFRPYLWEIRNIPTLIGAVESFILFLFFFYLIIKLRGRFFKIIFKNKDILFMMIFSVIFGVIVGVSSYNFGALSRYKMPAQLLFVTALFLIYNIAKDEQKSITKR